MPFNVVQMRFIAALAAEETFRQGHTDMRSVGCLLNAYQYAVDRSVNGQPTLDGIMDVAFGIDSRNYEYRHINVTFANSRMGTNPATITEAMKRLWDSINGIDAENAHEFVRAFLSIHPFIDGNGRTAWVLLNWLRGTLDHPISLPDFDW